MNRAIGRVSSEMIAHFSFFYQLDILPTLMRQAHHFRVIISNWPLKFVDFLRLCHTSLFGSFIRLYTKHSPSGKSLFDRCCRMIKQMFLFRRIVAM